MQTEIEILSKSFNKYSRKKIADIAKPDLERVYSDIDNFLAAVGKIESDDEMRQALAASRFASISVGILHVLAKFGDAEQLQQVLDFIGHDQVDLRDANQFTPLHFASFNGRAELVKILLAAGAEKLARTSSETRQWLAMHYAAKNGYLDVVKLFLDAGVDLEIKTSFGLTALHIAAEFGHPQLVQFLLSIGAKKDDPTIVENLQMTPLHHAVTGNFLEVAKLLLQAGASRNKRRSSGENVLEIAAKNNMAEMASLLLSSGVEGADGALKIAKSLNQNEVAKVLEKFLQARNKLFSKSEILEVESKLAATLAQFNKENLSEFKIVLSDGTKLNAYGICALKKEVGLFKKTEQSFAEFCAKSSSLKLAKELVRVGQLIGK